MNVLAGIFWDPREPVPEELLGGFDVAPEEAEHNRPHREPRGRHVWNVNPLPQLPQPPEDIIIREPERNILPPLSISLRAKVVQDIAQVTITQLFRNDSDYVIPKCSFTLPLPAGCTVTDFTCRIGRDKVVKAKVKPKEEARNAFDHGIRNNRTAGLLEQATSEVFTTSLGNIPKMTKLRAEISFVTLLKHGFANRSSTTTLTIPTCIASRYGNPPAEVQGAIPIGISQKLAIEVEVTCAERVRKLSSDSHRITVESRSGVLEVDNWEAFAAAEEENEVRTALVKLEDGSAFLERDFVLDIVTEPQDGEELPQAWLEVHPSLQDHKALMLTIPPKFFLKNQPVHNDDEIIFMADLSGSMIDKMESLKSAMMVFLQSIPQGRKFNIWCFGTHHTCLWPNSLENVRQQTLDTARTYVERQFHANMGGTELLPALKAVVGARDTSRMTDIMVLTDGQVWQLDETISYVQQMKIGTEGALRVFALGIGDAVSHELVEGLAKAGGGYAEVIPSASQGGWEDRLVAMLAAAVVGHILPLRIELDGGPEDAADNERVNEEMYQLRRPQVLKSPTDASSLSPFLRNRVYMLFDPQSHQLPLQHIKIIASPENGQENITKVPVKLTQSASASIHKLGARAILGDLERGHSWIQFDPNRPSRHSPEELDIIRSEGESLGCKWALVSKWTSFYAADEPYEPDGHEQDPFMDVADGLVQRVEGMDLLRRRGCPDQPVDGRVQGLFQAGQDMDVDLDGEDGTPDSDDAGPVYRNDDDSDSDGEDGGGGGPQGGGQANLEGAGEGQPPQPDRENPGSGGTEDRNEARGPQNEPNTGAAQHAQDCEAGEAGILTDLSEDSPLSQGPTSHQISYGFQEALNYRNPHLGSAARSLPQSAPRVFSGIAQPDCSGGMLNQTYRKRDKLPEATKRTRSPIHVSPTKSRRSPSHLPAEIEGYNLASISRSSYRHDVKGKLSGNDDLKASGAPVHDSPRNSSPRLRTAQSPSSFSQFHATSLSIPHSNAPATYISSDTHPSFNSTRAGDANFGNFLDAATNDPPWSSTAMQNPFVLSSGPHEFSTMNAPSNNLSAASALIPNQTSAPKSEDEQHGERIVQRLVQSQRYDGSFDFGLFNTSLKNILGDEFLVLVDAIADEIPQSSARADTMAIPIAIVTLFELRLEFCRELWSMIVSKAKIWTDAQFSKSDLSVLKKIEIYDFARHRMQSYQLPMPAAISPSQNQPQPQLGPVSLSNPLPVSMPSTVMTSVYAWPPPPPTTFSPMAPSDVTSVTASDAVKVGVGATDTDRVTRARARKSPLYTAPARPGHSDGARMTLDSAPGEEDV